jgi:outer membrane receptor protein involved in Fe transport
MFMFREGDFADNMTGHIGPRVFSDAQARFEVNDKTSVFAGVDNIFDEYVMVGGSSGDLGQTVGWTTFPDIYDGLGRRYYAGVKLRF